MNYGYSVDNYSMSESSLRNLEKVYEKNKIGQLRGELVMLHIKSRVSFFGRKIST